MIWALCCCASEGVALSEATLSSRWTGDTARGSHTHQSAAPGRLALQTSAERVLLLVKAWYGLSVAAEWAATDALHL